MNREEIKLLVSILNGIIDGSSSFHDANLKITKSDLDPEKKKRYISYLGAVLRNYVSLSAVINSYFSYLPKELRSTVLISMVIIRFSKIEEEKNEIVELLKLSFRDFELENFFPSLTNLVTFLQSNLKLVPLDVKANSMTYFACIYNVPESVLRMWSKQFGFSNAIKSASAYNRRLNLLYRVNTSKTTTKDLVAASNGMIKETQNENIVIYDGKIPFRKTTFHNEGLLFRTNLGFSRAVSSLELKDKDVLLYVADESVIPNEIFLSYQEQKGKSLDVLVSGDEIKYPLLQKANLLRTERQYIRTSGIDGLEANLHRKYNSVIYIPKSTKFDDITSRPELLIQLDLAKLTPYTKQQLDTLIALSEYVQEQGEIIYMVPTLSKKETHRLVQDFIQKKPEFILEKEEQIFPFEKGGSTLYCAILKKDAKHVES